MNEPKQPKSMEGGCLCGAIRYQIDGVPRRTTNCHCLHCRRASGAAFVTWIEFHPSDFRFVSGTPARYDSRARVTRQFCGRCGTQLTYQHADEPDTIDVTACSLDNVEAVSPEDHVWCDRMVPWLEMTDGLPRYQLGRYDDWRIRPPSHQALQRTGGPAGLKLNPEAAQPDVVAAGRGTLVPWVRRQDEAAEILAEDALMRQEKQDRRIDYVEFPTTNMSETKRFYTEVFGWEFKDYGPEYTSFSDGRLAGGFAAASAVAPGGPLVVLYATKLEDTEAKIKSCGGRIVRETFEFPGGRRFHFTDPSGNELAVWSDG